MEKETDSSLFVNDGSFMERFKQLQQQKDKEKEREKHVDVGQPKSTVNVSGKQIPKLIVAKSSMATKNNEPRKTSQSALGGKLAFSLKQKSKLVAPPVKLDEDEDEEGKETGNSSDDGPAKRQKFGNPDSSAQPSRQVDVAPPSPSDPTVKKVADKLASFVAKNGRQFEDVTRQKNPGDTPFKFLFDRSCSDYKYYEYRLSEEEKSLSESRDSTQKKESRDSRLPQSGSMNTAASNSTNVPQKSYQHPSNYQMPTSALFESIENARTSTATIHPSSTGESSTPNSADPIAMMEYYMKKAAEEEKLRPPKPSKDEMPPPASLQAHGKKGHHMGDYIPPEELEKFMASCNDATSQKATKEAAEKARIQADNIGHKLLSKMGWKEGEGLGSSRSGISDPIMAGGVKQNNLGVGASNPGEVMPEDDIYEQYKKRMMLGYRYRPNPLNNPRKAYY